MTDRELYEWGLGARSAEASAVRAAVLRLFTRVEALEKALRELDEEIVRGAKHSRLLMLVRAALAGKPDGT